ncbi:cobalt-precorrin-6A reductase [Cylindrospermopsis curvispora]|uniref:Cobalt-precorrin-6A reductase n=1 Tax=Cylindrospermopsis curvispora GIHE-G1 TaxID=2666332 RepID=A0A7H0F1F0_9CYAN|nr:cobalt-precorrin-6A reductase [Cylindrospermopsis curvispora]QNP29866.1 cobalt-precorrin-6A reductase [Cylindrospermopsis curvispora GIHE-G1]
MIRVLILGGTGDAIEITNKINHIPEIQAIASWAGRTRNPVMPPNVRIGGFGGVPGLVEYLREQKIDILIDATHPFADSISWNADRAAREVGIPRLLFHRPGWEKEAGDNWIEVGNHREAAAILHNQSMSHQVFKNQINPIKRVFLTIGRQEIAAFAHLERIWFLMRMIDPPAVDSKIPCGEILFNRGPFDLRDEREILTRYNIDAIVSKNSGGSATYPKIIAAREMGIPVVMVKRPPLPPGEQVTDVEAVINWLMANRRK